MIEGGDTINVSGIVVDSHKEPINEANVRIIVNGKEVEHVVTAHNGKYVARFQMDKGEVQKATIEVNADKASFKGLTFTVQGKDLARQGDHLFLSEDMSLDRHLGPAFWISTIVFIFAYVLIAFELLHRTVAAMLGDQVQAQVEPGMRATGAEQVAVLANQLLDLQIDLRITLPKLAGQRPMGGGASTLEYTGGGQQEGAAAQAGQLLMGRSLCQPGQ